MQDTKRIRLLLILFMTIIITFLTIPGSVKAAAADLPAADKKQVSILFTHDLHSHLESYEIEDNGVNIRIGGFAKLKSLIDEKKKENPDLLIVDAGDTAMGTLYQTLFQTDAIEYRMLGQLGYDAATFGNHEFDYGSDALSAMYTAASEKEQHLPVPVICNIDWNSMNAGSEKIYTALKKCGLKEYIVIKKGNVKIAVTGVFGKDALSCAPTCELTEKDPIESVKKTVNEIKSKEDADMIVVLSHSGTSDEKNKSEDEQLAKAVPDIDVIISGHSHTELDEPIIIGNTYIMSCGCYGKYTGTCNLKENSSGRWDMDKYELVEMTDSISDNQTIKSELDSYKTEINDNYLSHFGLSCDQIIAHNNIEFETSDETEKIHTEHLLGNIMSDAYRYAADRTPAFADDPSDVSCIPAGTIRGTYLKGNVTVSDIFDSFSLGSGPDGMVGYPLISLYLTGRELRTLAEVDASVSDHMTTARLYMSGVSFTFDPHRLILDKVSDIYINPGIMDDTRCELKDDEMYHVVADLYSGRMLSKVTDVSKGLLSIIPKDVNGDPIENFDKAIIYDSDGNEVKAWYAIAEYMQSFDKDSSGVSEIPAYYAEMHGRKKTDDSISPVSLFRSPNRFFFIITGVLILAAAMALLLVVFAAKKIKKCLIKND